MIEIIAVKPEDVPDHTEALQRVYRAAFSAPPFSEGEEETRRFSRALIENSHCPGFRLINARQTEDGSILGFAYGLDASPAAWFHDEVKSALPHVEFDHWFGRACFDFRELAVLPSAQGQGIGGRLHDTLFSQIPHRMAVLSTLQAETLALELYRRWGWVTIHRNIVPPGYQCQYLVMGLEVDKWRKHFDQ